MILINPFDEAKSCVRENYNVEKMKEAFKIGIERIRSNAFGNKDLNKA